VEALTALLAESETFIAKGSKVTGAVPVATGLSAIAPGYKKPKITYDLLMGSGWLPKQLKLKIMAAGRPTLYVTTTYGGWGTKLSVKVPK
jgi:hypothetical protein